MRIFLCTADGGGNVPALASIVGELVRRGHTVRVLAGPYFPGAPRSESLEASFSAAGCEVVNREAEAWLEGAGPMPDILAIPDHLQMLRSMAIWMPMSVPWAVETARESSRSAPQWSSQIQSHRARQSPRRRPAFPTFYRSLPSTSTDCSPV